MILVEKQKEESFTHFTKSGSWWSIHSSARLHIGLPCAIKPTVNHRKKSTLEASLAFIKAQVPDILSMKNVRYGFWFVVWMRIIPFQPQLVFKCEFAKRTTHDYPWRYGDADMLL